MTTESVTTDHQRAKGFVTDRHGPHEYVWVEAHAISLHEESTQFTRDWPDTSELEAQIAEAKATHGRVSGMLMRKDKWLEMGGVRV